MHLVKLPRSKLACLELTISWPLIFLNLAQTCYCAPTSNEIAKVAETYLRKRGISLTKVLILDASHILHDGSVKLETSFLSLPFDVPPRRSYGKPKSETSPLLFDALASDLLVVVLFRAYHYNLAAIPEVVQNIRHKCILQIIFTDRRYSVRLSGVSYVWMPGSGPKLYCARTYDQLMATWSVPSESCGEPLLRCRLTGVIHETVRSVIGSHYSLVLTISCNKTKARLYYTTDLDYSTARTSVHDKHMESKYSTCPESSECHALIVYKSADITALIKAFRSEVWILTLLSVLLMAVVFTWTQPEPISFKLYQTALYFINAHPIEAKCRKYSVLIIACTMVSMTFLLSCVYSNTFLSDFLSHASDEKPQKFMYCAPSSKCDFVLTEIRDRNEEDPSLFDSFYCDLSVQAQHGFKKPLRRVFNIPDSIGNLTILSQLQKRLLLSSSVQPLPPYIEQLLLVLTTSSENFERFLQHGFASRKAFERKIVLQNSGVGIIGMKTAIKYQKENYERAKPTDQTPPVYLSFDQEEECFDLEDLKELIPALLICGFLILCAAAFEVGMFDKACITRSGLLRPKAERVFFMRASD